MTATEQSLAASRQFMLAARRLPSLYPMTLEYQRLLNELESDDPDTDLINAQMEELAGDIQHKAFGVANVISSLKKQAEWEKAEGQRMTAKAKATLAHVERFEQYVIDAIHNIPGLARIETGNYTLSVRLNNPKVEVVDEAAIPPEFWRQPPIPAEEVDKVGILDYWRATGGKSTPDGVTGGSLPPGVSVVRGERLEIK